MNRRTVLRGVTAMAGMASASAGQGRITMAHGQFGAPEKVRRHIRLPKPSLKGKLTLEEVIAGRRSVREFSDHPLSLEDMGQLLWAAGGITGHASYLRAHPSAGALHPLEIYLLDRDGIFHYESEGHRLVQVREGDQRADLAKAAYRQWFIADAPCALAIMAVYARTTGKYGDRGRMRYVPMDAAHAAQNVLLQAVGLGLAAVPVGAFDDEAVRAVMGTPANEVPLYLIPVGRPRGQP